jgi:hypothetical protein
LKRKIFVWIEKQIKNPKCIEIGKKSSKIKVNIMRRYYLDFREIEKKKIKQRYIILIKNYSRIIYFITNTKF